MEYEEERDALNVKFHEARNRFDDREKLAVKFSRIPQYLSGYIDEDRQTLEFHKELVLRAHALLECGPLEIFEHHRASIVQGTSNMALSYLGLSNSEYKELCEGARLARDFLIYLYKRMKTDRLQITCALEFVCNGLERRGDYNGLIKLFSGIQSITIGRDDNLLSGAQDQHQTEARQRLEMLLSRIEKIRQLQEQPSNDLKERVDLVRTQKDIGSKDRTAHEKGAQPPKRKI